MIHQTPRLLKWLYPSLLWRVPAQEKVIYLTFDDGPVPNVTDFVLDTLEKYNAKAVFFCVGENIVKYPKIHKRVVEQGHKVGNHTFNHLKGWNVSNETYFDNIDKCEKVLLENPSALFRPPYGRITLSQIRKLKPQYKIVMWDVLTADYNQSLSNESCLTGSIRATRPGSVVVFHDQPKTYEKIQYVLPKYLEHFSKLGYKFELIPD